MEEEIIHFADTQGLKFFGKVNASISHELKNIFAIISETAGFLDDLTQLSKQGETFDLSILENCNASIAEEIERGFHTIRQMNRFAHSVDETVTQTDVAGCLELVIQLTRFQSYSKPVQIIPPPDPIYVETSPFLLHNLIYQTLCYLYHSMGEGEIQIEIGPGKDAGAIIGFTGDTLQLLENFPEPDIIPLGNILNVNFNVRSNPPGIEMMIPETHKNG